MKPALLAGVRAAFRMWSVAGDPPPGGYAAPEKNLDVGRLDKISGQQNLHVRNCLSESAPMRDSPSTTPLSDFTNFRRIVRNIHRVGKLRSVSEADVLCAFRNDFEMRKPRDRRRANFPLQGWEPKWQKPGDFQLIYRATFSFARKWNVDEEAIVTAIPKIMERSPTRGGARSRAGRREQDWREILGTDLGLRIAIERALNPNLTEIAVCRKIARGRARPNGIAPECLADRMQDRLGANRKGRAWKVSPRFEEIRARERQRLRLAIEQRRACAGSLLRENSSRQFAPGEFKQAICPDGL